MEVATYRAAPAGGARGRHEGPTLQPEIARERIEILVRRRGGCGDRQGYDRHDRRDHCGAKRSSKHGRCLDWFVRGERGSSWFEPVVRSARHPRMAAHWAT